MRFGPYTLVRRIGTGGMGEVFLALEDGTGQLCVIKRIRPELVGSPHLLGRFRDEVRVALRLAHPRIVQVYSGGQVDGQLFLAMEYVQGPTLLRLNKRLHELERPLPVGLALLVGERICEGLAYAHEATDEKGQPLNLVHRDLTPANVCLSYQGEVKLIDFGTAHSTLKEEMTAPQVVFGNLGYMAPEQARKQPVDRRSDVYAVGAVLWELLAWRLPEVDTHPRTRWQRAAFPQWEPPSQHRPGLPPEVEAVVMKALAVKPQERFGTAGAMAEALRGLREQLGQGGEDSELGQWVGEAFAQERAADEELAERLRQEALQAQQPAPPPVQAGPGVGDTQPLAREDLPTEEAQLVEPSGPARAEPPPPAAPPEPPAAWQPQGGAWVESQQSVRPSPSQVAMRRVRTPPTRRRWPRLPWLAAAGVLGAAGAGALLVWLLRG